MAKPNSKKNTPSPSIISHFGKNVKHKPEKPDIKQDNTGKVNSKPTKFPRVKQFFAKISARFRAWRAERYQPHHSFRRSYREDYRREVRAPGFLNHAATTFQLIRQNWRVFLPFILLMTLAYILLVGLMNEDYYQEYQANIDDTQIALGTGDIGSFARAALLLVSTFTSGGLDTGMDDASFLLMIFLFLIMWLATIFLTRHFLVGSRPRLRDALYNSLSPLLSTIVLFVIIFLQSLPIIIVIITYNAAVLTDFLATPFYALLYFIFASLLILLSCYLLSSSLMALVAVTAPGVYPLVALASASDLVAGRRLRVLSRVFFLLVVVAVTYIICVLPIILLDLWLKSSWDFLDGIPIVPLALLVCTCYIFIYATIYLYRYYRWLLETPEPATVGKFAQVDDRQKLLDSSAKGKSNRKNFAKNIEKSPKILGKQKSSSRHKKSARSR